MDESIRILVVDDEDSVRKRCVQLLARHGYTVVGVADSVAALEMVQSNSCDIMLVDIRMPGMDGMELLERVKADNPAVEAIMMTGYAAVETAVKAMKCGAYDYLTKPFDTEELLHVVQNVAEKKSLQKEVALLRGRLKNHEEMGMLIGNSPAMNILSRFIQKVAPVDCTVLLNGESGTGKELVARYIHANSPRSQYPFVVADCAALSGTLLESELFGHARGAFTGAYADRKGYFEMASRGTIFLDEIGELPLDLQGKLLRSVEEHVITKVGSSDPIKVDVRILAATNRNLEELVAKRGFRSDLFYRINVVSLKTPPLRNRREDIPSLCKYFLNRYSAKLGISNVPRFSQNALNVLAAYDWPGNVRELENAVQRALVLAENDQLSLRDLLPAKAFGMINSVPALELGKDDFQTMRSRVVRDFTKTYLESHLKLAEGNVTRLAEALKMRRTSLQRLLKQSGLNPAEFRGKVPPK